MKLKKWKTCTLCGATQPACEFLRDHTRIDGLRSRCADCRTLRMHRVESQRRRKRDPAKLRQLHVRRVYGLSEDDFKALSAKQNGLCAICIKPRPLVIDHNHKTGATRGLLCYSCNTGIGLFYESEEALLRAVDYLKEYAA